MDGFGLRMEAVERGDVVTAPGPQTRLFRAEMGVQVTIDFERGGLLLLVWKGGRGGQG